MRAKCKTILIATAIILTHSLASAADTKYLVIPTASSTTCNGPGEVISGGGRCWKDRNLGASLIPTWPDYERSYGDLYQWGRLGDGHQNRTSRTIDIRSANDVPGHSDFIKTLLDDPRDWRDPENNTLWQGLGGVNNPCPQGFRIPTVSEWDTEMASWDSQDSFGALASPLKLVMAGYRNHSNGIVLKVGEEGNYWSSRSASASNLSVSLTITSDDAFLAWDHHARGASVRCIKD